MVARTQRRPARSLLRVSRPPEASTWSTRSAASMNDVDTDQRRHTITDRAGHPRPAGVTPYRLAPPPHQAKRGSLRVARPRPRPNRSPQDPAGVVACATQAPAPTSEPSAQVRPRLRQRRSRGGHQRGSFRPRQGGSRRGRLPYVPPPCDASTCHLLGEAGCHFNHGCGPGARGLELGCLKRRLAPTCAAGFTRRLAPPAQLIPRGSQHLSAEMLAPRISHVALPPSVGVEPREGSNRYPMPGSVRKYVGRDGSGSSFLRSCAM